MLNGMAADVSSLDGPFPLSPHNHFAEHAIDIPCPMRRCPLNSHPLARIIRRTFFADARGIPSSILRSLNTHLPHFYIPNPTRSRLLCPAAQPEQLSVTACRLLSVRQPASRLLLFCQPSSASALSLLPSPPTNQPTSQPIHCLLLAFLPASIFFPAMVAAAVQ